MPTPKGVRNTMWGRYLGDEHDDVSVTAAICNRNEEGEENPNRLRMVLVQIRLI